MSSNGVRDDVLRVVASRVPEFGAGRCPRVAIDGPDGAGKTVFADALADTLRAHGRTVVRVSIDGFHQPRSIRYRRGRDSPEGFWLDSYDYSRFRADVLDPLGPGGSRRYRPAAHDVGTDAALHPEPRLAEPGSVLAVDGIFLNRAELADVWDVSVFLDVPFGVTALRMAERDGIAPDVDDPRTHRYVEGQRLYFAAADPKNRADLVVDNVDFHAPRIVRS